MAIKCPECGAEYETASGLGTHRHYAHGYNGEVRVKPGEKRSAEYLALARRLARMERKLEKMAAGVEERLKKNEAESRELRAKLRAFGKFVK